MLPYEAKLILMHIYSHSEELDNADRKAFEIAFECIEKQRAKKAKHVSEIDKDDNAVVECVCGATQLVAVNTIKRCHCWKCGQAIDWSDEE